MFAATLCFIRETVYHRSRFVASIKQGLAQEIFLCYVWAAKVGAGVRVGLDRQPRRRPKMADQSKSLVNTVELGRAIRRKREGLGLSLRDVADETGVSA